MTLRELWELFPIILSRHEDHWKQWAAEEISTLENALGRNAKRISHIGSTAVERICAKPIVDILLEVADGVSFDKIKPLIESVGYRLMSASGYRMSFNKGYTPEGFADRVFHLHLRPEQLADTVILVGDPGRVALVAEHFENVECRVSNREFNTVTGTYKGRRMTVLSTGIGIGNIDISVTELDALANVDFATRQEKAEKRQLTLVRLGTSGAIQPDIKVGDFLFSRTSVGFDGLLSYYKGRDAVCDLELEEAFVKHTGWYEKMPRPYFVNADKTLFEHFKDATTEGMTIAAPGFYAPQGRWVRLEPHDAHLNEKIESFDFGGRRITNFEMEGSALAGLAALMGHRAATICTIIAQRIALDACTDYKPFVKKMIVMALDKLATL